MRIRLLLLIALSILSAGSSCLDSQTVLPGQLGQVTDAVMVSCKPYASTANQHQCLLLTNPYQRFVKVFDATDNQFVLSPIAYFPLVIQIGKFPGQLASLKGQAFALDGISREIYIIPDNFVSSSSNLRKSLDFFPQKFALGSYQDQIWAFISGSDASDTLLKAKNLEGDSTLANLDFKGPIDQVQVDETNTYLLVVSGSQLFINSLAALPAITASPVALTAKVNAMTVAGGKVLLALADQNLVLIDLATQSQEAIVKLDTQAFGVYLPASVPGKPNQCCNGVDNWVAVLLNNGKLQYWPYAGGVFKDSQTLDITLITGVASYVFTKPVKLLGTQVENFGNDGLGCSRRLFLVYSGSLFNLCEASGTLKRLSQDG